MFAATNFEFKYRFWAFGAIFFVAFFSYLIDPQNIVAAFLNWMAKLRGTPAADWQDHAMFAIGTLFCIGGALLRTWGTAYQIPK